MKITSSAFPDGGKIPSIYTCDGKNINPPLEIHDVPQATKTLALIMDDPDVPSFVRKDNLWVHWVIYNIPPETRILQENSSPPGVVGIGTEEQRYQGPCPPDREHRYFFKLYALDSTLKLGPGATKEELEGAMKGHILEQTQLMGRYHRIK
jgi:hypothetical protein